MKYLLLCYEDEQAWDKLAESDQVQLMKQVYHVLDDLKASGQFLASARLQPTTATTCVRVRDGKMMVIDGPFAETREQLGGFFLIDAPNLDEAIRTAARFPGSPQHTIEIRPVLELAGLPEA